MLERSRDLVCQGHVNVNLKSKVTIKSYCVELYVQLTYKVTLDSYSVELYIFDIHDPKNLQNKKKIIALVSLEQETREVTFRVMRP